MQRNFPLTLKKIKIKVTVKDLNYGMCQMTAYPKLRVVDKYSKLFIIIKTPTKCLNSK